MFNGLSFSHDEIESFKSAFDGTPIERLLHDVVQGLKDAAKIALQFPSIDIEGVRKQQGIIYGLDAFKSVITALLEFNEEAYLAEEVENQSEVEAVDEVSRFDF